MPVTADQIAALRANMTPEERAAVDALLSWTPPQYVPLNRLRTTSTAPQERFWADPARFRCLVGGIGSGKTRAGVTESLRQPSGSRGMIVAPTYVMLRDSTLHTWLEQARSCKMLREWRKGDREAVTTDGKCILFRSADDPDSLRGPNLGWFYLDEAALMHPDVWLIMIGRLRLSPGRGWATSTPAGYNWLYEVFGGTNPTADYSVTTSSTRDNVFNPAGFVESLERRYDEHWRKQEIEGLFVALSRYAVFNVRWLNTLKAELRGRKPVRTVEVGENGFSGRVEVWKEPEPGHSYVIGADPAEGPSRQRLNDFSEADVFDDETWEQVAHYSGEPIPWAFGQDLVGLGTYYNGARINVLRLNHGHAVIASLEAPGTLYPNLYWADDRKTGFPETSKSKPEIVDKLQQAIQEASDGLPSLVLNDEKTVDQLMAYVRREDGSTGAEGSGHDDRVSSLYAALVVLLEWDKRTTPFYAEADVGLRDAILDKRRI